MPGAIFNFGPLVPFRFDYLLKYNVDGNSNFHQFYNITNSFTSENKYLLLWTCVLSERGPYRAYAKPGPPIDVPCGPGLAPPFLRQWYQLLFLLPLRDTIFCQRFDWLGPVTAPLTVENIFYLLPNTIILWNEKSTKINYLPATPWSDQYYDGAMTSTTVFYRGLISHIASFRTSCI